MAAERRDHRRTDPQAHRVLRPRRHDVTDVAKVPLAAWRVVGVSRGCPSGRVRPGRDVAKVPRDAEPGSTDDLWSLFSSRREVGRSFCLGRWLFDWGPLFGGGGLCGCGRPLAPEGAFMDDPRASATPRSDPYGQAGACPPTCPPPPPNPFGWRFALRGKQSRFAGKPGFAGPAARAWRAAPGLTSDAGVHRDAERPYVRPCSTPTAPHAPSTTPAPQFRSHRTLRVRAGRCAPGARAAGLTRSHPSQG